MADLLALARALTHHLPYLTILNSRGNRSNCIDVGTISIDVPPDLTRATHNVERTRRLSCVLPLAIAHANGRGVQ